MTQRREYLFVVRLWQERSDAEPPGQWRGSAQHVPSGERAYFLHFTDMVEFMRSQLARPSLVEAPGSGQEMQTFEDKGTAA
ncbi:MAG: hypothetical protein QG637_1384 [Chloroflexota bacterium]|nr:hypothetical protein [Chloroflexota bacterium]